MGEIKYVNVKDLVANSASIMVDKYATVELANDLSTTISKLNKKLSAHTNRIDRIERNNKRHNWRGSKTVYIKGRRKQ